MEQILSAITEGANWLSDSAVYCRVKDGVFIVDDPLGSPSIIGKVRWADSFVFIRSVYMGETGCYSP